MIFGSSLWIALGLALAFLPGLAVAGDVLVRDAASLRRAIDTARPGDRIVLLPGEYRLGKILIRRPGTRSRPIVVTAISPDLTRIHSDAVELFKLDAPYWIFENLDIVGADRAHHAFHIVGRADDTILRGNRIRNFHAAIKGNPERRRSPDRVVIARNIFFNTGLRRTAEPVTVIDVVGGEDWVIRENFIADFAKGQGDRISYAAFLKGGSRRGLFERNLVICAWRHSGGRRVGLSFGGGGSARSYRIRGKLEHQGGIMRNNIIMNCTEAPGIYLNRALNSRILHNTLFDSFGIMSRFSESVSVVRNNVISGAVSARAGARLTTGPNLETGWDRAAELPGAVLKLSHRISDYHVKYPSIFDRSNIRWARRTIENIGNRLARSFIGRGTGALEDIFGAPGKLDFRLRDGDAIRGRGAPIPDAGDDFCGRSRDKPAADLGAISYGAGRCDVRAWLATLLRPFGPTGRSRLPAPAGPRR